MSGVFDAYAAYYDLLYSGKEYGAEAEYVLSALGASRPGRVLLELGCGTGGHALEFAARGHRVVGVDISPSMVERARRRLTPATADRVRFDIGDLRVYRDGKQYDAVVSLFHVISYQTTNDDLHAAMRTAAAHLRPGGLFLFDCWHGPGVLADPPTRRVRGFDHAGTAATRIATPTHDAASHVVHVDYAIVVQRGGESVRIDERHSMRYLFPEEVADLLADNGFDRVASRAWMRDRAPGREDWYACHAGRLK